MMVFALFLRRHYPDQVQEYNLSLYSKAPLLDMTTKVIMNYELWFMNYEN